MFLETGFQFAETLAFKQQLTEGLGLNVVDLVGEYPNDRQEAEFGARLFESNPELCCEINKVKPMFEALRGLDAWITSVRRDSSPTRATTPIVERYDLEPDDPIVKVNPMANWTKPQVWQYLKEHDLPHNPLYDLGYSSIGCAPCTRLALRRRARARRTVGRHREVGVRDSRERDRANQAEPATRAADPDELGDRPRRLGRQRDLEPAVLAVRVPVPPGREPRLRGDHDARPSWMYSMSRPWTCRAEPRPATRSAGCSGARAGGPRARRAPRPATRRRVLRPIPL